MKPIVSIATTTLGEAIRRRVLLVILLAGLLLLSILPGMSVLSTRGQTSNLISTMFFVIQGTSVLISIVLTVYMIPNEIERRTIYTILCKPVSRWQFLLGKYFGAVLSVGLMMGLMTLVSLALFYIQLRPSPSALVELVQGPLMFFVQMCLLTAVTIFFSTFASPLVNFFLSTGIYLMGTTLSTLYDSFTKNPETHPVVKSAANVITMILPNFSLYNVSNPLVHSEVKVQNTLTYYVNAAGYGIIYVAALLIAGMLIFDKREV
ncbi:MAG: ABC transporter permease [Armatimonadetes bacterium]|nr:ABC transporter permease [Armatimonadota bacterium]